MDYCGEVSFRVSSDLVESCVLALGRRHTVCGELAQLAQLAKELVEEISESPTILEFLFLLSPDRGFRLQCYEIMLSMDYKDYELIYLRNKALEFHPSGSTVCARKKLAYNLLKDLIPYTLGKLTEKLTLSLISLAEQYFEEKLDSIYSDYLA